MRAFSCARGGWGAGRLSRTGWCGVVYFTVAGKLGQLDPRTGKSGLGIQKAGAHGVILRSDPTRVRHGLTSDVHSHCKRSRTAIASRSRYWEDRSAYGLTHRAPAPRRSAWVGTSNV
jgi:hypothetical protein